MECEQKQEEFQSNLPVKICVSKQDKKDLWQTIGILTSLTFGLWGAVLSTWQQFESIKKDRPIIYAQPIISPTEAITSYSEQLPGVTVESPLKEYVYEVRLRLHNAGTTSITLEPSIELVVLAPDRIIQFHGDTRLELNNNYELILPVTIDPGHSGELMTKLQSQTQIFIDNTRYNYRYKIIVRDAKNESYSAIFSEIGEITMSDSHHLGFQQLVRR